MAYHQFRDAAPDCVAIDRQHENLFVLFRGLDALLDEPNLDVAYWFNLFFRSMSAHANLHFGSEEALMERHRFPGIDRHRQKHVKSLLRLLWIRRRFQSIGSDFERLRFARRLLRAMRTWTTNHISRDDQRFANFLRIHASA